MGLKLKSRTQAPPAGFLYEQKQTAWRNWIVEPTTVWDFRGLCLALQQHRLANPRYKLSTNMADIEAEVDAVNAARVAQIPGAKDVYLIEGGPAPNPPVAPQPSLLRRAAVGLSNTVEGASLLAEWLGDGGKTVPATEADRRASVCALGVNGARCPKNLTAGISDIFALPVATLLRKQLELRDGMKLRTTQDDNLGTCGACGCILKLKVFVEPEVIKRHLTPEIRDALVPECWIRTL